MLLLVYQICRQMFLNVPTARKEKKIQEKSADICQPMISETWNSAAVPNVLIIIISNREFFLSFSNWREIILLISINKMVLIII